MLDLLIRAGCFVAVIVLGFVLKKIGFFHPDDFHLISKIVMRVTLPAAIILILFPKANRPGYAFPGTGRSGRRCYPNACGISSEFPQLQGKKAFEMINHAGLNIGNFTLPFVQSFIGTTAVIVTSLFDIGNAVICLGGAYGVAATVKDGSGFEPKCICKAVFSSVAFDVYIVMVILNLAQVTIPAPVVSLTELIANANVFLAMLMIGVCLDPVLNKQQIVYIMKFLGIRYLIAALLALGCYFLLPFALEIRQALVLLMFSPPTSTVPAFVAELDGDVGLASTLNSISIFCSIIIIITLLTLLL